MKRFLLDTGMAQDFIYARRGVRERATQVRHRGCRIGICVPVLGELWSGVEGSASRDQNALTMAIGEEPLPIAKK
jgi:tRNA(fMet)-specific endonuclease VapC